MAERPLRIAAFLSTLGGGGAEKHVERLANAVDRERATIEVVVVRRGGSYEAFIDPRVELTGLAPSHGALGRARFLLAIPRLRTLMASGRWDAVIAVLERPALVALAVHATLPPSRRPKLLLSVQVDPEGILGVDPLGPVLRLAMQHAYRRADAVIAISEGVAASLRRFDRRLAPVVIPNACIDANTDRSLREAAVTTKYDVPTVVACGRLARQKGFDVLLDAFARVLSTVPDARLRILGTGPLLEALTSQAERLGIGHAVTFVGFVDEPLPEFARAHVFCLSSRFEGLGMVVVEAMAAGTPVVVTDCPHGPADIVEGGRHGVLVPVEDARALGAALLRVLRDPALAGKMSLAGRARAESYRADTIASRHVALVESLLDRS